MRRCTIAVALLGTLAAVGAAKGEDPYQAGILQVGTGNSDTSTAVSADGLSNVYISGDTFGSLGGPNVGGRDAFVAKYDATGNLLWTRQLGTSDYDEAHGVSADGLDNAYISGGTFGSLGGPNAGNSDAFVAKYDAAGTLLWTRQLGTHASDDARGVSADALGNVYVSGGTVGSLGGPNPGENSYDAFVAKYNAAGTLLWTRQLGTSNTDLSLAVSADGLGNAYISGLTTGSLGGPNAGSDDAFVAKYDAAGTLLWTRQLGTSDSDSSYGVSADGLGNVYVSGYTDGALSGSSAGRYDAFVAKYDSDGNWLWTRQLGTTADEYSDAVSADAVGNVYIAGWTEGSLAAPNAGYRDAFVAKYDATGNLLWTRQYGTSGAEETYGVSADALGNAYISGLTGGSLGGTLGGDLDVFVAKLAPPSEPRKWILAGGGSYNNSRNWAWHMLPNAVGTLAEFGGTITGDSTVNIDSPVTVGTINFDNAHSYTLAGPAEITLETSGGDARINVLNGSHTISSPVSLAGDLTVHTAAETTLRFTHGSPRFVIGAVTKEGLGEWVLDGGIMPLGQINLNEGTLQVRRDLLALPGGEVNIAAGGTLKIGGSVNRRVLGVPGAVLEATADGTSIGLFSSTDGYNFQGHLEVGAHSVGLMDADKAQVYETHLGGGSLSSFNGIGLQAVDVFGTLGTHQGWLTGHGTVKGAVRFEVEGMNFAAIAGDGPGQEIVLDGVVSGSGWLEWVIMTGLHRPGASAGFTGLGQGTNIGPGATVMGIDGTAGFATPNPAENAARGYDQWFAMFGQHAISGDLTMSLEAPTPGGERHVPDPSVRYEIFKSFAPGGNPINAGWYVGWFNNVTLDPIWPNPTEWVWEFDYLRGGLGHGTEPDPGRAFYSATLMVIPEPSTLVLLSMGALVLTVSWWRRRRARTALAGQTRPPLLAVRMALYTVPAAKLLRGPIQHSAFSPKLLALSSHHSPLTAAE